MRHHLLATVFIALLVAGCGSNDDNEAVKATVEACEDYQELYESRSLGNPGAIRALIQTGSGDNVAPNYMDGEIRAYLGDAADAASGVGEQTERTRALLQAQAACNKYVRKHGRA